RYRIGARQQGYKTLREKLNDLALQPFRAAGSLTTRNGRPQRSPSSDGSQKSANRKSQSSTLWALRDVSFEIQRGEIVGIIGRKFDEIVAFAEIERFLDTPIKHYSSGMYMRLAFAVSAHLEPDILLVDEVLSVGDASFQKKCLGKMEEFGSQGRTVLFVSHSMPMIMRLCERTILLDCGAVLADGKPHDVIKHYLYSDTLSQAQRVWPTKEEAPGDSIARLRSARVLNDEGQLADTTDIRKPISVEVEYWNLQSSLRPTAVLHFINEEGICLFATNDFNNAEWFSTPRVPGLVRATCRVPGNFLAEGRIFLLVAVVSYNPNVVHAMERDAVSFQVVDRSEGDAVRGVFTGEWPGVMRPMLEWQVTGIPEHPPSPLNRA